MHTYGHSGVETSTAKVRRKYWIIKACKLSKSVKPKCVVCREMAHKWEMQLMADLPVFCLALGETRPPNVTESFHLELVVDCSTTEFMEVLHRYFSIWGYPAVMLSDNGSQMVGAARELREMVEGLDANHLCKFCGEKGIQWIFTTPAVLNQNGCVEAPVIGCKNSMKKAIVNKLWCRSSCTPGY